MSTDRPNPFVGLRPFERDEAMLFFGRDEQTLELLERLHEKRFLAVVGSSGCGKSSLVRAGLLSKLQASTAMSDRWQVVTLKPGSRPFTELAAALGVPAFAEALRTGGLTPLLDAITPFFAQGGTSLLLLVDQFEELFRFGLHNGDEARREEAAEFVALLLGLARQTTFPVYVVITLRSDFLGDCDAFRGLPEALNESQYLVPRLPRGKRQEAIEGPVRLYGRRIAPRLVDRLLNDGGAAPDQLPVLQHALLRVWDAAGDAGELDIESYKAVGGLAEALSNHAKEALTDLAPDELAVAEKLFRALTTTDADKRQTRRPRTFAQLMEETGVERERLIRVINVFRGRGRSFLMPPPAVEVVDDTLVDISHESLIRQWETLRAWVEAEAEAGKIYRRLAEDAGRYDAGKGSLLVDRALEAACDWRRETQPTAAWAQRYGGGFAAAMAFLAESERREKRRVVLERAVKATLAVLFLLISVLSVFSVRQWLAARQSAIKANFNLANMYEEKAGSVLKDALAGDTQAYAKAWLFSLAALKQPVGDRSLPAALGNLLAPDLRTGAFQEIWRSPQPSGPLNAVAFSPDGRRLASASDDRMIRVWDMASGQSVAILKEHSAAVRSVAFSPDGRRLASASWNQTIRVWDVASGQSVATLKGHSDAVLSVAFSPDGRRLASASSDRTVRVWDVASGHSVATLKGHSAAVRSVAFSSDGRRLASASSDRTIRVWDMSSGQRVATLKGHSDAVLSVAFSPNGRCLASASSDRTIRVWDVSGGQRVATLQGHSAAVRSVAFSPDGRHLASASLDRTIRVWDVASAQSVATLQVHSEAVWSVAFSPDGLRLASASADQTIRVWDVSSGQSAATLQGHSDVVWSVAFSPDGRRLASASYDQTIRVWDVPSGQSVATLQGHSAAVWSVAFSPDGRRLASASSDRTIRVWDVSSGQSMATLQGHSAPVVSVAFSPDGRRLASASEDRTIRVWDVSSGQSMATLQGHSEAVWSVAFSPDGRRLASASKDQMIRVWDVSSGQSVATLQGHSAAVWSVAFSPDGRRLASASGDRTIRIWDVSSGQSVATLQGHSDAVWSVAFSPDGRRLASASEDRTIRVWDVSSGQSVAMLQGDSAAVLSVAFSPDGRRLASASGDQTIRFWFASFPEALASSKTRAAAMEKIYRASLHVLRYRPTELDFEPLLDLKPSENPGIDRPRPLDKDVLEWLLEIGEKLPKEPE
jgi:WD40 repeat protein